MIKDFKTGDVFSINVNNTDVNHYLTIGHKDKYGNNYAYAIAPKNFKPTQIPVFKKDCLSGNKNSLLTFLNQNRELVKIEYAFSIEEEINLFNIDEL